MSDESSDLRLRTERILRMLLSVPDKILSADVQSIVRELQAQQIELERQNKELHGKQQELETARKKYFELYDLAPLAYVTLSEKGIILETNLTDAPLFNQKGSHLIMQPIRRFIFREDLDIYDLHLKRLFETSEHQESEVRMLKGDGTQIWARMVSVPAKGTENEPTIRMAIIDITHGRQREEANRASLEEKIINAKKEWEDTFDAITEILFLHDSHGKIVRANTAYEKMAGMSASEFVGRPYYEIFPKMDAIDELCKEAVISGKPEIQEIAIDSIGKIFSVRMYPKLDVNGKYLYSVHVMLDITERKKVIEAQIMKETAVAANKARSDFLAGMSHEFRTPLNAIIGFSDLMSAGLAGELTDKQREYITDIFNSGQHLLNLVNDILDLSKVEAGKMELEINEFDIKRVVENSIALFKEKAFKQDLHMTVEIADGLETMTGDERKIKQVLFNLLSNAVKFTPDGGSIHVGVTLTVDKAFLKFSVSDTGIGISTEDQKKIFEPFQQGDTILTREYKGTGLGLSLCNRIVELHGGDIRVESKAGKGSTFIFIIPRRL